MALKQELHKTNKTPKVGKFPFSYVLLFQPLPGGVRGIVCWEKIRKKKQRKDSLILAANKRREKDNLIFLLLGVTHP